MVKRLAAEKKEREQRQNEAIKIKIERMAEQDALIEAEVMRAKEDRINQIRNGERVIAQRVPLAHRSRVLNQLRQEQSRQNNLASQLPDNAESGSVGQHSGDQVPQQVVSRGSGTKVGQLRMMSIDNGSIKSSGLYGKMSPFPMTPSGGQKNNGLRMPGSGVTSISKPMKTLPNRKPLYIEMAQRVEKNEKEGLEEKKKRLEEIRAFH